MTRLTPSGGATAPKPPRFSRPWFRCSWKLLRAFNAERRADFGRALQLMDEAAEIMPLQSWFRVKRANLLLRLERFEDAHRAFDALRQEFKDSSDPTVSTFATIAPRCCL